MKRITIERYKNADELGRAGLIEGETDDGRRWIMFLGKDGAPEVYWPQREEDGAVVGQGIRLDRVPGQFAGVFEHLGVPDDADADVGNPEVVATFPVFIPDEDRVVGDDGRLVYDRSKYMRGCVFAVVPGSTDVIPKKAMTQFLTKLTEEWLRDVDTEDNSG